MPDFVLPTEENRNDVLDFYKEFEENGDECIGFGNRNNYDLWLREMQNRHTGRNLPAVLFAAGAAYLPWKF